MGYEIDEAEVAYWGRCPDCIRPSRAASPSKSPARPAREYPLGARRRTTRQQRHESRGQRQHEQRSQRSQMPVLREVAQRPIEPGLVAGPAEPESAAPASPAGRSDGQRLRLRQRVQDARSRRGEKGHRAGDDDVAGLVAGGLRPLRSAVHPDGLAQRGHLPHPRRPRRGGVGHAAVCAPGQLARQRKSRQGAPAALARQAEVRPEAVVGGPDGPHRQRRARVDGIQDLRLRRGAEGRLGTGGGQLGIRGHVARRRALQRRSAAGEPAWRRADGSDLREPGRPERQAGSRSLPRGTSAKPSAAWR